MYLIFNLQLSCCAPQREEAIAQTLLLACTRKMVRSWREVANLIASPYLWSVSLPFVVGSILMFFKPRIMIAFFPSLAKLEGPEADPEPGVEPEPEAEPEFSSIRTGDGGGAESVLSSINDAAAAYLAVTGIVFALAVQQYYEACLRRKTQLRERVTGDIALIQRALILTRRMAAAKVPYSQCKLIFDKCVPSRPSLGLSAAKRRD